MCFKDLSRRLMCLWIVSQCLLWFDVEHLSNRHISVCKKNGTLKNTFTIIFDTNCNYSDILTISVQTLLGNGHKLNANILGATSVSLLHHSGAALLSHHFPVSVPGCCCEYSGLVGWRERGLLIGPSLFAACMLFMHYLNTCKCGSGGPVCGPSHLLHLSLHSQAASSSLFDGWMLVR